MQSQYVHIDFERKRVSGTFFKDVRIYVYDGLKYDIFENGAVTGCLIKANNSYYGFKGGNKITSGRKFFSSSYSIIYDEFKQVIARTRVKNPVFSSTKCLLYFSTGEEYRARYDFRPDSCDFDAMLTSTNSPNVLIRANFIKRSIWSDPVRSDINGTMSTEKPLDDVKLLSLLHFFDDCINAVLD